MGPFAWITVGLILIVVSIRTFYDLDSPILTVFGFSLAVLAGFLMVRYLVRHIRFLQHLKAIDARLCPHCLYDLTESPADGTCPECGTPYSHAQLRQFWLGEKTPSASPSPVPAHDDNAQP